MSVFVPKNCIPLGEAVTSLGQSLFPGEWTGEELVPELGSMSKIESDTDDYLIGWIMARCAAKGRANRNTVDFFVKPRVLRYGVP